MLQDIQKKYGEIFENHFTQMFENKLKVECKWGFPVLILSLISTEEEVKSTWSFSIDVFTKKYSIQVVGYRGAEGAFQPEYVGIDSDTINFIIDRVVEISESMFNPAPTEKAVEEVREEVKE